MYYDWQPCRRLGLIAASWDKRLKNSDSTNLPAMSIIFRIPKRTPIVEFAIEWIISDTVDPRPLEDRYSELVYNPLSGYHRALAAAFLLPTIFAIVVTLAMTTIVKMRLNFQCLLSLRDIVSLSPAFAGIPPQSSLSSMTGELNIHCRYAVESADPLARLHERTSKFEMLQGPIYKVRWPNQ